MLKSGWNNLFLGFCVQRSVHIGVSCADCVCFCMVWCWPMQRALCDASSSHQLSPDLRYLCQGLPGMGILTDGGYTWNHSANVMVTKFIKNLCLYETWSASSSALGAVCRKSPPCCHSEKQVENSTVSLISLHSFNSEQNNFQGFEGLGSSQKISNNTSGSTGSSCSPWKIMKMAIAHPRHFSPHSSPKGSHDITVMCSQQLSIFSSKKHVDLGWWLTKLLAPNTTFFLRLNLRKKSHGLWGPQVRVYISLDPNI